MTNDMYIKMNKISLILQGDLYLGSSDLIATQKLNFNFLKTTSRKTGSLLLNYYLIETIPHLFLL